MRKTEIKEEVNTGKTARSKSYLKLRSKNKQNLIGQQKEAIHRSQCSIDNLRVPVERGMKMKTKSMIDTTVVMEQRQLMVSKRLDTLIGLVKTEELEFMKLFQELKKMRMDDEWSKNNIGSYLIPKSESVFVKLKKQRTKEQAHNRNNNKKQAIPSSINKVSKTNNITNQRPTKNGVVLEKRKSKAFLSKSINKINRSNLSNKAKNIKSERTKTTLYKNPNTVKNLKRDSKARLNEATPKKISNTLNNRIMVANKRKSLFNPVINVDEIKITIKHAKTMNHNDSNEKSQQKQDQPSMIRINQEEEEDDNKDLFLSPFKAHTGYDKKIKNNKRSRQSIIERKSLNEGESIDVAMNSRVSSQHYKSNRNSRQCSLGNSEEKARQFREMNIITLDFKEDETFQRDNLPSPSFEPIHLQKSLKEFKIGLENQECKDSPKFNYQSDENNINDSDIVVQDLKQSHKNKYFDFAEYKQKTEEKNKMIFINKVDDDTDDSNVFDNFPNKLDTLDMDHIVNKIESIKSIEDPTTHSKKQKTGNFMKGTGFFN